MERKEFYKGLIIEIADQMAADLDNGYSVELSKSRSGLKLFQVKRKHEVIRKPKTEITPNRK